LDDAKFLRLSGAVGALCLWAAILIAGALTPGYSHARDAISKLGMEGAPVGWVLDWLGLAVFGVGVVITGLIMLRLLRPGVLLWLAAALVLIGGIGVLLVGFSPCRVAVGPTFCSPAQSPINARHAIGTGLAFALIPLAALLLGLRAFRAGADRGLYTFTLGMALAMIGAHLLIRTAVLDPNHLWFGLWQRILVLTITVWVFGASVYLFKRRPPSPPPAPL
jgi:hypothetical protein